MSEYTTEEIANFEAKERRIVRQSSLNRAVDIAIAFWTHPQVKSINPENLMTEGVEQVCKLADKFVNYVYDIKSVNEDVKNKVNTNLPIPTLEQANIFSKLAADVGQTVAVVQKAIWDKKNSYVVENYDAAKKYLLSIKENL